MAQAETLELFVKKRLFENTIHDDFNAFKT